MVQNDYSVPQKIPFYPRKGFSAVRLKPGPVQNRKPHLYKIEGPIEQCTEKSGSKKIIHEE